MEAKWIAIMAVGMFVAMFSAIGVSEYSKSQCQIEGIRAGLTADAIVKTCGKTQ